MPYLFADFGLFTALVITNLKTQEQVGQFEAFIANFLMRTAMY